MTWPRHVSLDRERAITAAILFCLLLVASARIADAQPAVDGQGMPRGEPFLQRTPAFDATDIRPRLEINDLPSAENAFELPSVEPLRRLPAIAEPTMDVGLPAPPIAEPLFPAPQVGDLEQNVDVDSSRPQNGRPAVKPVTRNGTDIPVDDWWRPLVPQPMRPTSQPMSVTLDQLITATLQYSDQVKVFSDSPLIRDMTIIEEDAEFDWVGFSESMWNDIDEPVGSTLTTGGPDRFQDERWETRTGVRRRTTSGGRFEAYQEFGRENSNSVFFQPNNQGTSQLTLSYSQPILRGAGRIYNSSLILLAQIDAGAARDEFARQLQSQLLDVSEAYWSLFQQRAALMQKQRLLKSGQVILDDLEHRADVDALASQILRARAAVATRSADLYRAETLVKNAESRIRALVNAPYLGVADQFELLPLDAPSVESMPVSMSDALALAIRNRPELHQALKRIKAAAVRLDMSKNELLPVFDLVLETYVRGLRGDFDVGGAFEDSFKDGAPSYSAGFQMEFPLGNRAANATVRRRGIEMRQLQNQFRATIDVLQLEVEVVVREVQTAFREIKAMHEAMQAAAHEVEYLTKRWQVLSGEDRSAALILEDLLAAQDRLAIEELQYVQSQIVYSQSLTDLKQVTGTLLQVEQIELHTAPGPDGNPVLLPVKFGAAPATISR